MFLLARTLFAKQNDGAGVVWFGPVGQQAKWVLRVGILSCF